MFYFRHIELRYGWEVKNHCSKWVKGVLRILILREQLTFLLRCKKASIFPSHIENKFNDRDFYRDSNRKISYELRKSIFFFKNKLLNFEIKDLNNEISYLNVTLNNLESFLHRNLNYNDLQEFFRNQERFFNKNKYNKRLKLKRKFEYLRLKKHSEFNCVDNGNKNWFKNLSDTAIPTEVVNIMSKGSKFGLPYLKKELPIKELIAEVESSIYSFSDDFKKECRSSLVKVMSNFKRENKFDNFVNSNLFHNLKITQKFFKENPNIIFQKADKGNVTVASNKNEYIEKIKLILDDDTTYEKIRDPHINKLQRKLKDLLINWKNKGFIDVKMYNYLKCENGTVAKCYGLPKIHKKQMTYRIIISSINFPTYKLSRFLSDILIKVVGKTDSYVKDSWSFYDIMKDIIIPNEYKMISLDVVSLFTNVPLELLNEIVNEKWSIINLHTKLSKNEFIKGLNLVFNNTVFSFDNVFYEQKYGCPMGSPLSPVVANLVMEKLESIALSKLVLQPILYKRYVDDIFTVVPESFVDEMVEIFNSINDRIKFTKEVESEKKLSFLDIEITRVSNNRVKLNWYRKPTWSGRFLNFDSHHQFRNKIGTLKGVIDRAIKLSHKDFRKENLKLVKKTFISNGYPIDFIDKVIDERMDEIYNSRKKNNFDLEVEKGVYFVLPYVKGLSERLKREFKKHHIQIFFSNKNNLARFFSNCKDKDKKDEKSGLVYRVNCRDCNKCYVGQTGRYLKKRMYEHKYSLTNMNITSGLKQHCLECCHSFDFGNVDILERNVINKYKRESLENIHIFKNKNNVNLMKESSKLDSIYHPFLK